MSESEPSDSKPSGAEQDDAGAETTESDTASDQDTATGYQARKAARRVFAPEFNDAWFQYRTSEADYATVWTTLPTGQRANRVFIVGDPVKTEQVDSGVWQLVVNDTIGDFYCYAGEYSPAAVSYIQDLDVNAAGPLAIVGKINTHDAGDGNIYVSVRPETISEVDQATQDQWLLETAEHTLARVRAFNNASEECGGKIGHARDTYGTDVSLYRNTATKVLNRLADR